MARATLEMFLKLTGANKTSKGLDKVSKSTKKLDTDVKNSTKANAQFSAGMSGLGKASIVGGALLAAKSLADFSLAAIQAASSAQEAAGAFSTTFGDAAEKLNKQLEKNANLFGLTSSEAQQLISVFGSVAQGIGFTQEESADLSAELFNLAGDIASFNNITAGAEPVLQAFRSALVGEREALKTYGIAITEAEVQTKAFEQTGKTSADALTRQEKALATTALIFERATVQQGNAAREASGFAAQQLIARSATQELREELGEQLLPAAGEVLKTFNTIRKEATPDLIERFEDLNFTVLGLVESFNRLREFFDFKPEGYNEGLEEAIKNTHVLNEINEKGFFGIKGLGKEKAKDIEKTKQLVEQLNNYKLNQAAINTEIEKSRSKTQLNRVAQEKYQSLLKKETIPTLEKYLKFLSLINDENEFSEDKAKELASAQDRLTEAQRKEALSTAEEALQKKELQQEIAELLFFQRQGVDVSEELAVAQEKLRLIEFELTRESEELREAKAELADIEAELAPKVEDTTNKLADQAAKFTELNEEVEIFKELAADEEFMAMAREAGELNPFLSTGLGLMSQLAELQGLDERAKELNNFAAAAERLAAAQAGLFDDVPTTQFTPPPVDPSTLLPPDFVDPALQRALDGAKTPANILGDNSNVMTSNGGGGGDTVINANFVVDDEVIQTVTTKVQQRGKTFVI